MGSAPHPPDRAYAVDGFAQDVAAYVCELDAPVLVGHSLGGHICLRTLPLAANVRGVLVFGAPLLSSAADAANAFLPNSMLAKAFTPRPLA